MYDLNVDSERLLHRDSHLDKSVWQLSGMVALQGFDVHRLTENLVMGSMMGTGNTLLQEYADSLGTEAGNSGIVGYEKLDTDLMRKLLVAEEMLELVLA